MADLIGFVHNAQQPASRALALELAEKLGLGDGSWQSSAGSLGGMGDALAATSLLVVLGGDGTILRTVRASARFSAPLVGVNMGRMGFMTELDADEAPERLPYYLEGSARVEERMMLHAEVVGESQEQPRVSVHALNDVVVGRDTIARLLEVDAAIDGVPLPTMRADAVIVATATGSTGYAMSAGGPVLYPEARLMIVKPAAPHTGLREPLVTPAESRIEIGVRSGRHTMLSADGFQDTTLDAGDRVIITRSPYTTRFLRADAPNAFYSALMARLGLERSPRGRPTGGE